MAYFLYNAAPGPMYFLGNEIKAEPSTWTPVSEYAVNHGTFNSMKRLKIVYLVESDHRPDYDPTHPDNKHKVESQAPGAAAKKKDLADGSMNEDELRAYLAGKNADKPAVNVTNASPGGKVEAITAENLAEIGLPPSAPFEGEAASTQEETNSGIKFEELGETVPFVKEAADTKVTKPRAKKATKTDGTDGTDVPPAPENLGVWS